MKYRNFDPETNQPISALKLLEKLDKDSNFELDTINITESITKYNKSHNDNENRENINKDITNRILKKYEKIAKLSNMKSIQKKDMNKISQISGSKTIPEYEEYLNIKYPLANIKTNEKISNLLTSRIKDLMNE